MPPNTSSAPLHSDDDDDLIDLKALGGVIWRGKALVGIITAAAIVLGGIYAYGLATPMYRSGAVVMLQTDQGKVVDLESAVTGLSNDASVINSETEVLLSRNLIGKVVDALDLTKDPEFNAALRTPSLMARVKGGLKAMLGGGGSGPALPEDVAAERLRQSVISAVIGHIAIQNIPKSLVFQITVTTTDPEKSARIADTLSNQYILNQLEVKFDATEQATSWLTDRVAKLRADLETAEARVASFSSGTELINADTLAALERQLKETRDRITSAENSANEAAARANTLQAATTPQAQAEAAQDVQLTQLLAQIDQPGGGEAFAARLSQVTSRAQLDASRTAAQLTALTNSRDTLQAQIDRQGADLIQLQQLTREAEASRMLYEYFLTRLKETAAQQGIQQADSRILSTAVVPNAPAAPKKSLILAMSGLLGLMIGIGSVLFLEFRKKTFRTARDLERLTGYTVLGQIPLIPGEKRSDALDYLAAKPTSAAAEAIRNLRTSVLLANLDNPPQVIVVSSSIPGEGKTVLSLALAQNFIGMGKKVLLIEGDIRRRVFSQYLDVDGKKGLISVLAGTASLDEARIRDLRVGADILIGEKSDTNAADIFSSSTFAAFIAEMRKSYDQIIIDTPPVLVVPDARVIAQQADALIVTVRWDSTTKSQVADALQMFESVNLRVSGLALNQISAKGMKRYGYGDKYGAYSGYGANYYTN